MGMLNNLTDNVFPVIRKAVTPKRGTANIPPETTPKAVGGNIELLRKELRDLENQQDKNPSHELLVRILRTEDRLREALLNAGEKLLIMGSGGLKAKRFFHGTPSKNIIKKFDIDRDASPNSLGGHGAIWVAPQHYHAKQYGDRVYETNLKANRLFNTAKNKEDRDLFEGWVRERVDKGEDVPIFGKEVKNGYAPGDDQYFVNASLGDFTERRSDKSYFPAWENNDWLVDKVKSTGKYDGLIVSSQNGELDIGVFSPEQVIVKGYFKKNGDLKKVSLPNPSRPPEGGGRSIKSFLPAAAITGGMLSSSFISPERASAELPPSLSSDPAGFGGGMLNQGQGIPLKDTITKMGVAAPVGAVLADQLMDRRALENRYEGGGLREPLVDPTTLMAGPARWGGGLMNMGVDSVMKYLMGQ
jgi:hypothetical protein